VCWQLAKLVDTLEEEEDGAAVLREKERFSNELTLVFCTREVAILKQPVRNARPAPPNGRARSSNGMVPYGSTTSKAACQWMPSKGKY